MMADFSLDDIDSMINDASQGYDFSNYFSGDSGANVDLGKLDSSQFSLDDIDQMLGQAQLDQLNAGDFSNMNLGQQDLGDALKGINLDNLAATLDSDQAATAGAVNLGGTVNTPLDQVSWQALYNEGLTPEQIASREGLMSDLSQYNQDFGGADVNKYMDEYQSNLKDIYENKGGFTSQWQNVDGRKVQVYDDGTGMAINPSTGAYKSLSESEVNKLIADGKLNTYKSGYNEATGGTKIAPGGGVQVVLKDGTKGILLSNGRVIDDKGTVIGNDKDVVKTVGGGGGGGGGGNKVTPGTQQQGGMGALLPLLLALLAMNKGGGGSGASSAVIPALTATQKQTPYTQIQQAPGYRPGQGGITYFNPVQYAPKMAAGGIADLSRGRLLEGPGDGVSDSIPATIGGMAGGGQPARLARGEYVIDARTVAALGNGSTDAGAERLDEMRRKILSDDRRAGVGKDSKAYRHLKA